MIFPTTMINIVPTTVVVIGIQYLYRIRGNNNNTIDNDTSLTLMDVFLVYGVGSSAFDDDNDDEEDTTTIKIPLYLWYQDSFLGTQR